MSAPAPTSDPLRDHERHKMTAIMTVTDPMWQRAARLHERLALRGSGLGSGAQGAHDMVLAASQPGHALIKFQLAVCCVTAKVTFRTQ